MKTQPKACLNHRGGAVLRFVEAWMAPHTDLASRFDQEAPAGSLLAPACPWAPHSELASHSEVSFLVYVWGTNRPEPLLYLFGLLLWASNGLQGSWRAFCHDRGGCWAPNCGWCGWDCTFDFTDIPTVEIAVSGQNGPQVKGLRCAAWSPRSLETASGPAFAQKMWWVDGVSRQPPHGEGASPPPARAPGQTSRALCPQAPAASRSRSSVCWSMVTPAPWR